jgi:hypothetical protein
MEARPMMVQSLLRHAMAEAISDGFINCLIVTSVADANIQLSRIHEHIFTRKLFFRHALDSTDHRAFFAFRLLLPTCSPFSCLPAPLDPRTSAYRIFFFLIFNPSFLFGGLYS